MAELDADMDDAASDEGGADFQAGGEASQDDEATLDEEEVGRLSILDDLQCRSCSLQVRPCWGRRRIGRWLAAGTHVSSLLHCLQRLKLPSTTRPCWGRRRWGTCRFPGRLQRLRRVGLVTSCHAQGKDMSCQTLYRSLRRRWPGQMQLWPQAASWQA